LKIAKYFKENKKNIEIENLFGVGHYICNAVKCFYYNEKVSILDINTSRIISRLFNVANNIDLRKNI